MKTETIKALYTKKAHSYRWLFIDILGWGRRLETFFRKSSYLKPNMKILDAGCGTGIVTQTLHALARERGITGIQFNAFDLAPAMLDMFRSWIVEEKVKNVKIVQANVLLLEQQLPADWQQYDLIVSGGMLEYVPKRELGKTIGNLKRLLKDGGMLVIIITRRNVLTRLLVQWWWEANVYEQREVEQALRQARFNSCTFQPFSGTWFNSTMVAEVKRVS